MHKRFYCQTSMMPTTVLEQLLLKVSIAFAVDKFGKDSLRASLAFRLDSGRTTISVDDSLEKRMSGISILSIDADFHKEDTDWYPYLIHALKRLQPVCKYWRIKQLGLEEFVTLTDQVIICSPCELYPAIIKRNCNIDWVFATLKEARNRSIFKLSWSTVYVNNIFDKVKDLVDVHIGIHPCEMHDFLWDFHESKERIALKTLVLNVRGLDDSGGKVTLSPFPFILQSTVPSFIELRSIRRKRRHVFVCFSLNHFMVIADIRNERYDDIATLAIRFVGKDKQALRNAIVDTYLKYGTENKEVLEKEFRPVIDRIFKNS